MQKLDYINLTQQRTTKNSLSGAGFEQLLLEKTNFSLFSAVSEYYESRFSYL